MMNVKVKKLNKYAKLPVYATEGAACFDIHATNGGQVYEVVPMVFHTGLAFEIPKDHVMLVFSRSGHGFNHAARLANCVGVIDSDYRGELMVKLTADSSFNPLYINAGDRVAQGMVLPVSQVVFEEVEELGDTERGEGGFGSTGA